MPGHNCFTVMQENVRGEIFPHSDVSKDLYLLAEAAQIEKMYFFWRYDRLMAKLADSC